jgi:hypothetical protein
MLGRVTATMPAAIGRMAIGTSHGDGTVVLEGTAVCYTMAMPGWSGP